MKYKNNKLRSTILLVLLIVGWAVGCPVSAHKAVDVASTPSTGVGGINYGTSMTETGESLTAPVLSHSSSDFHDSFTLTISDINEPTASIRYTLDESEPGLENGTVYSEPITIQAGNDVTVKAVSISEDGKMSSVTTATYHFVPRHLLCVKMPNKNGINYVYYSSNSDYGYLYEEDSARIVEGEKVYVRFYLNNEYKCTNITLNGDTVKHLNNSFDFVMPASDVEIVIDTEFDPSSPADPQPADTTTRYNLTVVCNPSVAGSVSGSGTYEIGKSVYVSTYSNSGYVFTGWTQDGDTISTNSNFYYYMPASDAVLMANYVYNPSSPDDPQQPALKHPLTVIASPAGAGTFSYTNSEITYGEEYYVYAHPSTGYKFKGWIVNGVAQEETSTTLRGIMTEAGAAVVGLFVFDPSLPDEPNLNYFDPVTGRMIIDHFAAGSMSRAINTVLGNNDYSAVTSLTVKGKINERDINTISSFSLLQALDLSRTNGLAKLANTSFYNLPVTSVILPSDVESVSYTAFKGCSELISLSLFSQVPPTVTSSEFADFDCSNCALRVPDESIELYKASEVWGKFGEIQPLGDAIHVLEVQLPSSCRDGRLKNNSIELINTATGRRQKYVITDRMVYTFNGVQKDDSYLVRMLSESGLEMARIENVIIPDADYAVAFDSIRSMVPVSAKVVTPEGDDVTESSTIEWYRIENNNTRTFLKTATNIGEVPEGEQIIAKAFIDRSNALKYQLPEEVEITVEVGMEPVTITLTNLRTSILTGKVVDESGEIISDATISLSQRIAGKYDKSSTVRVDKTGKWSATIIDASFTSVSYSAPECINETDTIVPDMTLPVISLDEKIMRSNVGARIKVALTFTEAVERGDSATQNNFYSNVDNILFNVYNESKDCGHMISVQYPTILVLEENIDSEDTLTLTVSEVNGHFSPAKVSFTVGSDYRPEVSLNIIEKGAVKVKFGTTDSPQVVGLLLNSENTVLKRSDFDGNELTFDELEEGEYTILAMTKSEILNSVPSISSLDELGLKEDIDYTKQVVCVENGIVSAVYFETIPSVDESLFSYTGSNTSITPNKSTITSGQYLTIRSLIDFKPIYRTRIDSVYMEFTIPENCKFVTESMMKGSNKFGYDINDNKVIVNFGTNYSEQLRFCVIPTKSGDLEISGRVIFNLDGQTVYQPVGSTKTTIKDFDFVVPGRTSYNQVKITGTAPSKSNVQIYQDGSVIGTGVVSQGGIWDIDCELIDTYNQKECQLQAVITTPDKAELVSETKTVVFDGNAIMIDHVTMLTGSEEVVFDFNHRGNTQVYTWVDDRLFTFIVKLTENAPENISAVRLFVKTLDGSEKAFDCYYSKSRDAWLCVGNFTAATAPINVAVSIFPTEGLIFDRKRFDSLVAEESSQIAGVDELMAEIDSLSIDNQKENEEYVFVDKFMNDVISNFDSFTNEEKSNAIDSVLVIFNHEPVDFEYPDSLIGNEDEINSLIEEARSLLLPLEELDTTKLSNMIEELRQLSNESFVAEDFKFETSTSGLTTEYDGVKYTYEEISASKINIPSYPEEQVEYIFLDDGSRLATISTETETIVVDSLNDKAWRILSESSSSSNARNLKDGETLKEYGEKIKNLYDYLKSNLDVVLAKADNQFTAFERQMKNFEAEVKSLSQRIMWFNTQLSEVDIAAQKILIQCDNASANQIEVLRNQYEHLDNRRKELIAKQRHYRAELNKATIARNTAKGKWMVFKGVVDQVTSVLDVVWRLGHAIAWGNEGVSTYNKWQSFIETILPCEADNDNAMKLTSDASITAEQVYDGYKNAMKVATGSAAMGIISTGVGYLGSFGPNPLLSLTIKGLSIIGDVVSGMIYDKAKAIYDDTKQMSSRSMVAYVRDRSLLKCRRETETDEFDNPKLTVPESANNRTEAGNGAEKRVIIDPAGYVYEGVHSNRIEGVQATVYYREEVEDMYGDKHLEVIKWNAEDYAQVNPLFTDANGMYAWDVPPGEWQVKFEKGGYKTTYSEWLPVPPPQLEVNVEITQNTQPEVSEVHAYNDGVEIRFNKYMDSETMSSSNIFVTANGEKLKGTIELMNPESKDSTNAEENIYVSIIRFVPEQSLGTTTGTLRLTIDRNVLSYAGIPMTETFTQELDIEKEIKEITLGESLVKVLYGETKTVTVSVIPAEAGSGRTLSITNSSPLVVSSSVNEVVLDENGQALITLSGDLPGSAQLVFNAEGTGREVISDVQVVTQLVEAENPVASMPNGSVVYRNSKVALTTDSKNATIYFTTDGSCPCDENGTRRKYTVPIVINEDSKILAMTAVGSGDEDVSETVEFNYTLKRSDMDFQMAEGWTWISHNLESNVDVATLATDEGISRILSQTQEIIRDPLLGMVGTLTELSAVEGYKVQSTSATERQRLSDIAWNPNTPIALTSGWNWLGYPVGQTMSVDEAFATTDAESLDVIVGQKGFAQFDGEKWVGTLETMSPGMGYMYYSQSEKNVVYNTSIVSTAAAKYAPGISKNLPLVLDIHKYGQIMPIIAMLSDADGTVLDNANYQVLAFCGSECRGIGSIVNGLVMMNVYGNANDNITFQVTDVNGEMSFMNSAALQFSEAVVGSLSSPYSIIINNTTDITDVKYSGNISVNVVGDVLKVNGIDANDIEFLEVYDINGQRIVRENHVPETGIKISSLTTGVYVVIVNGNGEYTYHKIAVN